MSIVGQKFHTTSDLAVFAPRMVSDPLAALPPVVIKERQLNYRLYAHFHPYADAFSTRLMQKSIAGLQAIDTEYERNADGTFEVLPNSVRVKLKRDGTPLVLPDGARVKLAGWQGRPSSGSESWNHSKRLKIRATRMELLQIFWKESQFGFVIRLIVLRPNGEPVELDPSTELTLLGSLPKPVLYAELFTQLQYAPNKDIVDKRYPVEDVDFTFSGAYSGYNWELFYHVPITIAIHLSKNQRFEEAQRWFHYVFDPTDDSDGPTPGRFWKVKPFQFHNVKSIGQTLINLSSGEDTALQEETINSIEAWKENPFRPHLIARYRQSAYMLKAVTAYLDNLVAWGDSLFRQDTGEAINEAMQLYVLAANILGPRPQPVPAKTIADQITDLCKTKGETEGVLESAGRRGKCYFI